MPYEDLEQLLVAAIAHAVTKTTAQLTFDRIHKQLQDVLRSEELAARHLGRALETELFFIAKQGIVDERRADAVRATLRAAV